MSAGQGAGRVRRRLQIVRGVALLDLALLIALVTSSLTGRRDLVHILGPLHGANFLLLLAVAATAALDSLWGWWFPAVILLTAGPPGALVGERLIARRIARTAMSDGAVPAARPGEAVAPRRRAIDEEGEGRWRR